MGMPTGTSRQASVGREERSAGAETRQRDRVPGRKTGPAYTRRRRTWYGHAKTASVEKPPVRRFLHDLPYVFTEILVVSIPALYYILVSAPVTTFGVKDTVFVACMTMVGVATLIHTGLIRPLATDTLGWVTLTPTLVAVRFVYYNLVLLAAAYGSLALGALVSAPLLALGVAGVIGAASMLAFPRLAETIACRE